MVHVGGGDIMMHVGDIMMHVGMPRVHQGMLGGYHEYSGGYHEYIRRCSVHRGDIIMRVGEQVDKIL